MDNDASGADDGTSWTDAFVALSDALASASAGDEVWVAEGVYLPVNQNSPFLLPPGVKLLGGFDGSESSRDERDWVAHPTTLDGDLNGDDQPGFQNRADNAIRVVSCFNATPGTCIDGFAIRGGYTEDNGVPSSGVGGGGTRVGRLDQDSKLPDHRQRCPRCRRRHRPHRDRSRADREQRHHRQRCARRRVRGGRRCGRAHRDAAGDHRLHLPAQRRIEHRQLRFRRRAQRHQR